MLCELWPQTREISLNELSDERLTVGVIGVNQLEDARQRFGFSHRAMAECLSERDRYRNSVDVYDDFTFCVVTIVDAGDPLAPGDKVAFFFKRNLFLMVSLFDPDGSTTRLFMEAARRYKPEVVTLEKVIAAVLEGFVAHDGDALAQMAFDLNAMEEEIAAGHTNRAFNAEVFERRKRLLVLRNYYEQLIDMGEELQENENDLFPDDAVRYLAMFTGRVTRLSASVQLLRDSLNQLREAYQAMLDYNLNSVMRVLTVLATIFLPLTLIVGWYGMNFAHMPELEWEYGYPLVIVGSALVVVLGLLYFKRKKLL